MIHGGNATIFVSDIGRALAFYVDQLGLKLDYRVGDHWAQPDAGEGLKLGLHPASHSAGAPGTFGAVQIGFNLTTGIEDEVATLRGRGVTFKGDIVEDEAVKLARLADPDGNLLYLCELKH